MTPAEGLLFENEIPIQMKLLDREEVCQPLQVTVSTGRGGPNGISRCVTVQVTDPRDPFFLYVMQLSEDEYGRFKENHELHVDFAGFPRDLVGMLNSAVNNGSHYTVTFVVMTEGRGILRIIERTEFRSLEHLKLTFNRQGDEGQKRYLAERFHFFQHAFLKSETERRETEASLGRLVEDLRRDVQLVSQERDEARQQLRMESTSAESSRLSEVGALKEQHNLECQRQRDAFDKERREMTAGFEKQLGELRSELRARESEVAKNTERIRNLENDNSALTDKLARTEEAGRRQREEIEELSHEVDQLRAFQREATQRMSQDQIRVFGALFACIGVLGSRSLNICGGVLPKCGGRPGP